MVGSCGGGRVNYCAIGGATAGVELECGFALSSGAVIAVSVAGVAGSNMLLGERRIERRHNRRLKGILRLTTKTIIRPFHSAW